jgi:hypothetical protein
VRFEPKKDLHWKFLWGSWKMLTFEQNKQNEDKQDNKSMASGMGDRETLYSQVDVMHYEGEGNEAAESNKDEKTDNSNADPGKGYTGTNGMKQQLIALPQRFVD